MTSRTGRPGPGRTFPGAPGRLGMTIPPDLTTRRAMIVRHRLISRLEISRLLLSRMVCSKLELVPARSRQVVVRSVCAVIAMVIAARPGCAG